MEHLKKTFNKGYFFHIDSISELFKQLYSNSELKYFILIVNQIEGKSQAFHICGCFSTYLNFILLGSLRSVRSSPCSLLGINQLEIHIKNTH